MTRDALNARCRCGAVVLEARGAPIVETVCRCGDCREAGRLLQGLAGAPAILDGGGGTPFVLFRKDRVDCVRGSEHLREHRLSADTPTRRIVATCCNSFMFLDFTRGHWVTLSRARIAVDGSLLRAPREARQGARFVGRLMLSWAAMGFRTPTIDYVNGRLGSA